MLRVFAAPICQLDPDDVKWEKYVTQERWAESRKWKKKAARAQSVGGELLLNRALRQLFPSWDFPVQYVCNVRGKKMLLQENVHFNLSHSGDYVACAVADKPVGIDIQQYRDFPVKTAQHFFAAPEFQALMMEPENERVSRFFDYWVLKESYVKMLGEGLPYLRNRCLLQLAAPIVMQDAANQQPRSFQLWQDVPGYRMAVCVAAEEEISASCQLLAEDWFQR